MVTETAASIQGSGEISGGYAREDGARYSLRVSRNVASEDYGCTELGE